MIRKIFGIAFAEAILCAAMLAQQPATPPAAPPAQAPAPAANTAPAQAPATPQSGAQPGQAPGEDDSTVIKINANEVDLIFTVTDKHGHYIPNLQQSDFALLDDQKAPAEVKSFHQQINLPLRVGIVIDASTSIRTRFQF